MIREAAQQDADVLLRLARRSPCVGARIEVDWTIAAANPRVPYQFYRPDDNTVLAVNTGSAVLAGTPQNGEELSHFFSFLSINQLFSDGWAPEGWQPSVQLRMGLAPDALRPVIPDPPGLDRNPGPGEVIAVLESDGDRLSLPARERMYADLQIRRNHGCAEVYGLRSPEGALIATAGAWALTGGEAYIACVETLAGERGRGHARALMAALARRFATRRLTLVCTEALRPFYASMGFTPIDRAGVIATAP